MYRRAMKFHCSCRSDTRDGAGGRTEGLRINRHARDLIVVDGVGDDGTEAKLFESCDQIVLWLWEGETSAAAYIGLGRGSIPVKLLLRRRKNKHKYWQVPSQRRHV